MLGKTTVGRARRWRAQPRLRAVWRMIARPDFSGARKKGGAQLATRSSYSHSLMWPVPAGVSPGPEGYGKQRAKGLR